ncbi:MAG: phosphate ABC transporter permease PstA [Candidatus Bipolaricaulota bacterium]|nr:phosphate ABC transporter permease PstA [Candidatus Bipolaricaulota bacterium]
MRRRASACARRLTEVVAFSLFGAATVAGLFALGIILYYIISRGSGALSWEFLTTFPRKGMTAGGIYPALVGSFYLTAGAIVLALPLALGAAIFLVEYAREGPWVRAIRIGVNTLAGVPSIVFGLLGLALFVKALGIGVSVLSGSLTLGLLILPLLVRTAEEALRSVPRSFREGGLALGATRWRTIRTIVLPAALPGILTGIVLGLSRAIGETAPIMFTAAAFFTPRLPASPLDEVMALPYHIFVMATESPNAWRTKDLQYGAVLVLVGLVLVLNLGAILLRAHARRRKVW